MITFSVTVYIALSKHFGGEIGIHCNSQRSYKSPIKAKLRKHLAKLHIFSRANGKVGFFAWDGLPDRKSTTTCEGN